MTFKFHPLHDAELHATRFRDLGVAGYHEWVASKRATGRSTALALEYIAAALQQPGSPVLLTDHPHPRRDGLRSKQSFAETVRGLVGVLNLDHLHVEHNQGEYYLTFRR